MELASLFVSFGIFVATAIAMAITWARANAAVIAQKKAEEARDEAIKIASDSRDALTDSARALETSNDIARSQLPLYPWVASREGNKIQIKNASGAVLINVTAENKEGTDLTPSQEHPVAEVHPNESIFFTLTRVLSSAGTATLIVQWQRLGSADVFTWRETFA